MKNNFDLEKAAGAARWFGLNCKHDTSMSAIWFSDEQAEGGGCCCLFDDADDSGDAILLIVGAMRRRWLATLNPTTAWSQALNDFMIAPVNCLTPEFVIKKFIEIWELAKNDDGVLEEKK